MIQFPFTPLVIIGAARSGTNMLRDILTSLPGFDTWPCDEIPYIWRHGNRKHPDDEFTPEMARPEVIDFIRKAFLKVARPSTRFLVEKTCANSLRVAFVDRVLPDARYIYIVRDGRDAAASAMKRWRAGFDLRYSLAKARFVPPSDLPYYGVRFIANRLCRLRSQEQRLAVWGPVFSGMRDLPPNTQLHELAARQWTRCVELADRDLDTIDSTRVISISYETFVRNPREELSRLLGTLGFIQQDQAITNYVCRVRSDSIGKGRQQLAPEQLSRVEAIEESALRRHGYLSRDRGDPQQSTPNER